MIKNATSVDPAHQPIRRFGGAIVACAVLAAAFPIIGLWIHGASIVHIGVALAGSLAAILLLARLLQPLAAVSAVLRGCLAEDGPADDTHRRLVTAPHGAGGLAGYAAELAERMEGIRRRLTNRHPVTGLPTREPFLAGLVEDFRDQQARVVLGVVRFADYDRLAAFDQAAADLALRAFAVRLTSALPVAAPVAQVDRDCFAIWIADADEDAAAGRLKALCYVLGQELRVDELRLAPSVEVGAAVFPSDASTPTELLTRAIAALDVGEKDGRKVAFFSAQGSAAARERFSLEQDLRGVVGRDELILHYQPVVDLNLGQVIGAEALLRWRHPTLGLVSPGRFIPLLEQSPSMAEVGLWVLNAACREVRAWRELGLDDFTVAVNLSAAQCRDPRLNDMVLRTLERHELPASSLELELTETAAMEDADHIRRLLAQLRAQGVGVAIDDFGSGYSSLSYLKNLPFSKLKIDREFVAEVDKRRDSRAICAALIALSRGLGIAVLAEGVETVQEVETLRSMGCRLFQGFFFARPMEAADFVATVQDAAWQARLGSPAARQAAELSRRSAGTGA